MASVELGLTLEPLVFWSDELRSDPLTGEDGLYFGSGQGISAFPLPPVLELASREQTNGHARLRWQSSEILDVIPQLRLIADDQPPVISAIVRRENSRTVTADVDLGTECSAARVELVVLGAHAEWTPVTPPLDLNCSPARSLRILAVRLLGVDELEVRFACSGACGASAVSLFDLAGRRLDSVQTRVPGGGEVAASLRVPRSQGVYWVEVKNAESRTSRTVVLAR